MSNANTTDATLEKWRAQEYKYGFYTDIETDSVPPGLNEAGSSRRRSTSRSGCSSGA
jgi:hypothetical protein